MEHTGSAGEGRVPLRKIVSWPTGVGLLGATVSTVTLDRLQDQNGGCTRSWAIWPPSCRTAFFSMRAKRISISLLQASFLSTYPADLHECNRHWRKWEGRVRLAPPAASSGSHLYLAFDDLWVGPVCAGIGTACFCFLNFGVAGNLGVTYSERFVANLVSLAGWLGVGWRGVCEEERIGLTRASFFALGSRVASSRVLVLYGWPLLAIHPSMWASYGFIDDLYTGAM